MGSRTSRFKHKKSNLNFLHRRRERVRRDDVYSSSPPMASFLIRLTRHKNQKNQKVHLIPPCKGEGGAFEGKTHTRVRVPETFGLKFKFEFLTAWINFLQRERERESTVPYGIRIRIRMIGLKLSHQKTHEKAFMAFRVPPNTWTKPVKDGLRIRSRNMG